MKLILCTILFIFFFSSYEIAQFPVFVHKIECSVNQTFCINGNLEFGAPMDNLSWAWKGSVDCFPSSQKLKFSGNHVLYGSAIDPNRKIEIILIPENKNSNFSLYAYLVEINNYSIVPDLKNCLDAESDYMADRARQLDNKRTVALVSKSKPNNLIIGVVGANGLKKGAFLLQVSIQLLSNQ